MSKVARITIDDNRFLFIESLNENLKLIKEKFTYPDFSECWERGKFKKENIKNVTFVVINKTKKINAIMPVGFLTKLEKFLVSNAYKYKIIDNRKNFDLTFSDDDIKYNLGYLDLYDYQVETVRTCLEKGNGIIQIPTSGGKTEIFLSLCNLTKKKTLILFSKIDLANQTLRRAKEANLDSGIVQGANIDENHIIVMATVQSCHKLQREDYEMILVDECHKATGDQYQEVLKRFNCRFRFGFSATPLTVKDKLRDAKTIAYLGSIIYKMRAEVLIENKRIADPTIHIITVDKPFGMEDMKWIGAERKGIIYNKYRNQKIVDIVNTVDGPILILLKNIKHGEAIQELIPNSIFLYGDVDVKMREKITKKFEDGEKFVLIGSVIFDEGISINSIQHLILAGGGKSPIKAIQRIGRGLRITDTKKTVDVYDFYDKTNIILEKHSIERIKLYEAEGFTKIVYD
jgi:superfamily II DNA or RNA helicase